ncbi:hypothetical protein AB0F81_51375, partial [Actinoplanes sp. NPDC024001]|uniref:hypothetical protein n=1 Tax=Actinoplanes sp. NPDC024001 TaxID=3154598 RepID=UPI003402B699
AAVPAAPAVAALAVAAPAVAVGRAAPVMAVGSAAPEPVCRIGDDRLIEISGLATDGAGYVVINDGADDPDGRRIFFLNRRCGVARSVPYPSRPRDTEDLARGPDGTLWVADIGDNGRNRETIALWRLSPRSRTPRLFRLTYPDGPHDAEALLIGADGTPVVVTKDPMTAGLYVPGSPLSAGKPTPMRKAGTFPIPASATGNPFGLPGRFVITGGATSADGRRVVLRTYADAFEFDVPGGGDLVTAITQGEPRVIPLPDEPQGEAIAYSRDGTALLTVSEGSNAEIKRYPLPDAPPVSPSAQPSPSSLPPSSPQTASPSSPAAAPQPIAVARTPSLPAGALIAGVAMAGAAVALTVAVARRRRP